MGVKDRGHSFSEAFIHQMIETIEFVLGTVSNTASYLRLWALSLAHSQLAETFMNLTFKPVYTITSPGITIGVALLAWPVFWSLTFGFVILVDLLEAVLHTLRLHWVEFQNKFFKGDGYPFKPYSYEAVLRKVAGSD
jgi:V-type H+-transporting ATPase subunit a